MQIEIKVGFLWIVEKINKITKFVETSFIIERIVNSLPLEVKVYLILVVLPFFSPFQHVDLETYIPCLVDLCKALWEVMKSYYKTMDWHKRQSAAEEEVPSGELRVLYLTRSFHSK